MPTVRSYCTDALIEIGAIDGTGEPASADDMNLAFRRFQYQFGAWNAQRATLAVQKRVGFTVPNGTNTLTVGPGGDVDTIRPVWIDTMTYVNPGSNPEQEVPVGLMTPDVYAQLSIKELSSALPLQAFYQVTNDTVLSELFIWPRVSQNVKCYIYFPNGVGTPTDLDDIIIAPEGYSEAFMYQLAERLLSPFAIKEPSVIQLVMQHSAEALARIKRPNLQPGQMGVDAALVPMQGGAYNILSDSYTGFHGGH